MKVKLRSDISFSSSNIGFQYTYLGYIMVALCSICLTLVSCKSEKKMPKSMETSSDIRISGAMKNVMWKGDLRNTIHLDTISDKKGLYGLGPLSYLGGELLINDGKSFVSKVTSDSTMSVLETFDVFAPFFVYGNVSDWDVLEIPDAVKSIKDLESFIDNKSSDLKRPLTFKLVGKVSNAVIHIQNLPPGTKVSSPKEAHQGQVNYHLQDETVEIIGFFSTDHKGIFTHHDSYLHMHLITEDERKMGHLDKLEIGKMTLHLPER